MLELHEVVAGYGRTMVLQKLTLHVEDGELVGVLGRNGVGKTTALKAIMGLIPVQSGTVLYNGEDLCELSPHLHARRGVALVPQGRQIFPSLSVDENLRVAAQATQGKKWRAVVDEILSEFPMIAERRQQLGGSLSGGQQQILAFARALVTRPELVLLDEPSEGVQPTIIDQISDVVRELCEKRGLAIVLVEQNLDFAARLVSRLYLMDNGCVVREMNANDILEDRALQQEYLGV